LPPREDVEKKPLAPVLSAETRSLLMSLSAAGIPCLTLDRGDDLVRRLSMWDPVHRNVAALR
jgi:hypothetical protein